MLSKRRGPIARHERRRNGRQEDRQSRERHRLLVIAERGKTIVSGFHILPKLRLLVGRQHLIGHSPGSFNGGSYFTPIAPARPRHSDGSALRRSGMLAGRKTVYNPMAPMPDQRRS